MNVIISRMPEPWLYPRLIRPRLEEALEDSPVVLLHGPRQSGKTTLAQWVGRERGYSYYTFDDGAALAAANEDPTGFVDALPERAILDEVQKVPDLLAAIKLAVDRDRRPGRFLLTGSANLITLPRVSESLAGRMELLRLHPLAQVEIERKAARFIPRLFAGDVPSGAGERLRDEMAARICAGGYPAALSRKRPARRASWYRSYVEALVQRDVRDLSRIRSLDVLPRLLRMAASQTARLLDVSSLQAALGLSWRTTREYLTLLSQMFLLEELPSWHQNRMKRQIKKPRLHMGDTGLACALLEVDEKSLLLDRVLLGQLLETFVFQELRRQAAAESEPVGFFFFRTKEKHEVDVVMRRQRKVVGVEVKAAATVRPRDFRGLVKLRDAVGPDFVIGVVLYDGELPLPFGDRLFALPLRLLWET